MNGQRCMTASMDEIKQCFKTDVKMNNDSNFSYTFGYISLTNATLCSAKLLAWHFNYWYTLSVLKFKVKGLYSWEKADTDFNPLQIILVQYLKFPRDVI